MSGPALDIQAVTKTFGTKVAVNNLTLRLEPGDFVGLLGRNGAGKSTTLNMVCGLLPTAGSIHVLGHDVHSDPLAAKRQIGVMPEGCRSATEIRGPQPGDAHGHAAVGGHPGGFRRDSLLRAGAWAVAFGMTATMVLSALTYRLALLTLADTVRLHQERVVTEVGRGS